MIGLAWYGEAFGPSGQCKIWVWRCLLQVLSAKLVPQPRVLFSPQNALQRHLRWIVTAYYYYFHRSRCPFSGRLLETLKRRSGLEGHRMEGAIMRERATWGAIIGSPLEGCWMLELDCMIRNLAVYQVFASKTLISSSEHKTYIKCHESLYLSPFLFKYISKTCQLKGRSINFNLHIIQNLPP